MPRERAQQTGSACPCPLSGDCRDRSRCAAQETPSLNSVKNASRRHSSINFHDTTQVRKEISGEKDQESARNSYSSITAATASFPLFGALSTRKTCPLQRTRMLSVRVISGGRVNVKSISEPAWMTESM